MGLPKFITDAYSRKIMGYSFRQDLAAEGCINALKMALNNRLYNESIILIGDHSIVLTTMLIYC